MNSAIEEIVNTLPKINAHYDPTAESSLLNTYLTQLSRGDIEWLKYVQQILGSCLTNEPCKKMFILYGTGSNGRTTLMKLMQSLLGPLALKLSSNIIAKNSSDPISIINTQMILIEEFSYNLQLDAAKIKSLLSTDYIVHCNRTTTKPKHKIFLVINEFLNFHDSIESLRDRIVVIPFHTKFVYDPQDNNEFSRDPFVLQRLLNDETAKSALFNWLLEGIKLSKEIPLIIPNSIQMATDNYFYKRRS